MIWLAIYLEESLNGYRKKILLDQNWYLSTYRLLKILQDCWCIFLTEDLSGGVVFYYVNWKKSRFTWINVDGFYIIDGHDLFIFQLIYYSY